MDDPIKEIVGAWFVAVGTIIAAVIWRRVRTLLLN
ncbi:hypothetical protein ABH959_004823 [Bacillus sp. RC51]